MASEKHSWHADLKLAGIGRREGVSIALARARQRHRNYIVACIVEMVTVLAVISVPLSDRCVLVAGIRSRCRGGTAASC